MFNQRSLAGIWSSPIDDCRDYRRLRRLYRKCREPLTNFKLSIASITSNIRRQKMQQSSADVRAIMSRVKLNAFHQTHPWRLLMTQQESSIARVDGVGSHAWLKGTRHMSSVRRQLDDLEIFPSTKNVSHANVKVWDFISTNFIYFINNLINV